MFIRKSKHIAICQQYDKYIFSLTHRLSQYDLSHDNGGPYKRILECREAAREISPLLPEDVRLVVLHRLAFIDEWLMSLIPLTTTGMRQFERDGWNHALGEHPPEQAYSASEFCINDRLRGAHVKS